MTKKALPIVSVLVIFCFLISSCASIISKSQYPVTISSSPDQAEITIYDEDGMKIYKGKTPTTVTLKAGDAYFDGKDYIVHFAKEGYEKQTVTISSKLDGWYVANLLFGGLIGLLIVDPLTGAMWKLDSRIMVSLDDKTASLENDATSVRFVLLDDVPEHLRNKMVRIK